VRAAILVDVGEMVVSEVDTPRVGDSDVLVRVKAATICGTDLRIIRGKKTKGVRIPSVIGHEFAGEIVEAGSKVEGFAAGDRVCLDPVLPCGQCFYCLHGMENICQNRKAIGYEYDGCYAEYVLVPSAFIRSGNMQRIPDGISWHSGALAEPLACCLNGQRKLDIRLGETVVVIGAGPIGLMHTMLAKASGAGKVIVSEPSAKRRNAALQFGADLLLDPAAESLDEMVAFQTGGLGADVIILAIGSPAMANAVLGIARKGGRISLFAGFSKDAMPPMDVNLIHYGELAVYGSSSLQRRDLKRALDLMGKKTIDAEALVSHSFNLERIHDAVALAESGDAIKIAIAP
jgi:L-iditol 2-dehydrogenase